MKPLHIFTPAFLAVLLSSCSSTVRPVDGALAAANTAPAVQAGLAGAAPGSVLPPAVTPKDLPLTGASMPAHEVAKALNTLPKGAPVEHGALKSDAHPMEHAGETSALDVGKKELTWLKNGNLRFAKNVVRNDFKTLAAKKALLEKLSGGQKPHTIVLSCSDSRVPPELVFDQVMGEVFVIRVAGEALDSSVIASIEYAAEHLGTQLLVVMGHESCGAVKAALSTPEGTSAGSPSLDKLVADIRPRISQSRRTPMVDDVLVESWANAKGVTRDLLARSPLLAERVTEGKLKVVSALYHLRTGTVDFE